MSVFRFYATTTFRQARFYWIMKLSVYGRALQHLEFLVEIHVKPHPYLSVGYVSVINRAAFK